MKGGNANNKFTQWPAANRHFPALWLSWEHDKMCGQQLKKSSCHVWIQLPVWIQHTHAVRQWLWNTSMNSAHTIHIHTLAYRNWKMLSVLELDDVFSGFVFIVLLSTWLRPVQNTLVWITKKKYYREPFRTNAYQRIKIRRNSMERTHKQ